MKKRNTSEPPCLVVSDAGGNVFEIPELYMAGSVLNNPVIPPEESLIPLPFGSDLFTLPSRIPIGYDPAQDAFVEVREYEGQPVFAAAAFMAPAYVQVNGVAYKALSGAPRLSLYCYTAVGWRDDSFYVPAIRIDPDSRQDLENFDCTIIEKKARQIEKKNSGNRLISHLVNNCVLRYGCPAARNFALGRWECPVPTSTSCNASCIGCISKQPRASGVTASHERLSFTPTVGEIVGLTVPHLEKAERAVVSFGQGCEGEPLMVGDILEEAIVEIRKRTVRGIINLNTNASKPDVVERLFNAGLDSIRVSLNSAQQSLYSLYYRPRKYTLADVMESLKIARAFKKWSSINYFVFPGLTDHPDEIAALEKLIDKTKINMIQARNLNIDPQWYCQCLKTDTMTHKYLGIGQWIRRIQQKYPWIKFGYFNPPREEMKKGHFAFR